MVKKRMRYWEVHYSVKVRSGWQLMSLPVIEYLALPERPLRHQFRKTISDVHNIPVGDIYFQGCTELTKAEFNRIERDEERFKNLDK